MPRMSDSDMMRTSSPSSFTSDAAVFGDENFVADCHGEVDVLSVFVFAAGAEGNDFSFLWFFLRCIRKDDAACADCVSFEALHEDALSEWFDASHSIY